MTGLLMLFSAATSESGYSLISFKIVDCCLTYAVILRKQQMYISCLCAASLGGFLRLITEDCPDVAVENLEIKKN